jgi:cellulose synthase/poly-beta-1,6-N-acetylglucosamine synthase-like glycosyltransferase
MLGRSLTDIAISVAGLVRMCPTFRHLIHIGFKLGGSSGAFVSSLISRMPWLLQLPMLVILSVLVFSVSAALMGYEFCIFHGLVQIRKERLTTPSISRSRCTQLRNIQGLMGSISNF